MFYNSSMVFKSVFALLVITGFPYDAILIDIFKYNNCKTI